MPRKALVNIDYTYDFVADDGKLTCGEPGQRIEERIVEVTNQHLQNDDLVVFAIDGHYENDPYHPESKLFPPHNIFGTSGRQLYGKLQQWYEEHQAEENVFWMDKTRYSAFAGTNLDTLLRDRGIDTVVLVGVCTDICILHTAVDAYNKGYQIEIVEDAVQSFDADGHAYALRHLKNTIGAKIV